MNALTPARPVIRFAPGLWEVYDGSLRRRKPEHYAVLGGYRDDPFRVTDFRPMPPLMDAKGKGNAGTTHVQLNKPFMDYYYNNELKPAGKSILGVIHSHPGGFTSLSGHIGGKDGDIPSMRGTLERAQAGDWSDWKHFLAPIVTFNSDYTSDEITGWIVTLESKAPIPADIHFEEANDTPAKAAGSLRDLDGVLDETLDVLNRFQCRINTIEADRVSPEEDRTYAMNLLRRMRHGLFADIENDPTRFMARIRERD